MRVWTIFYGNLSLSQGPTTHFTELAKGLVKAGLDVTGYAPNIGHYLGELNFKINYTPTINIPFLRVVIYDFLLMIRLFLTPKKPDIIYVRVAYFTFFTPLIAKIFRKKLILEINGYVVDDVRSKRWRGPLAWISIGCEGFLHRIANGSIIVTETIYEAIHAYFNISKSKLYHIKNGVNVDHFRPLDKIQCRKEVGLDENTDYIGYVGCFTGWDGIEHIVRVLPQIRKRIPNVKVLLVGDGDHRSFVEKEVKKLNLEEFVKFTGIIDYQLLPKYLNCFTVAIAPYGGTLDIEIRNRKGLSSLKCLEYSSVGLPMVVADIPGMDFIDGKSGLLIPQGDENALAEKIVLLLQDKSLRDRFSKAGREHAVKNASWQSVAKRTKEIFQNLN